MKLELVDYTSTVLKQRAKEVVEYGEELRGLFSAMEEIMFDRAGVGISAPQVGVSQRVIVITDGEKDLLRLVNPEVISSAKEEEVSIEGCLSYPDLFLGVWRPPSVRVGWKDEWGESREENLEGTLARVFWHELDHLNGVTLRDKASNLKWTRWLKERKREHSLP